MAKQRYIEICEKNSVSTEICGNKNMPVMQN